MCPEKHLVLGRSGTTYVAMVTKFLRSYFGVHLVESNCKESKIACKKWVRYPASFE